MFNAPSLWKSQQKVCVLQCGAMWCNVVQCGAVWCSVLQWLQCVAVCCSGDSVLQYVAVPPGKLPCVSLCLSLYPPPPYPKQMSKSNHTLFPSLYVYPPPPLPSLSLPPSLHITLPTPAGGNAFRMRGRHDSFTCVT